jgi:hypothetical protein
MKTYNYAHDVPMIMPMPLMQIYISNEEIIDKAKLHGISAKGEIISIYYSRIVCPKCNHLFNTIHKCYNCSTTYSVTGIMHNTCHDNPITSVVYNNTEVIDVVVPCSSDTSPFAYCFNYEDSYYIIQNGYIFYAEEMSAKWLLGHSCFYRTIFDACHESQIPIWHKTASGITEKAFLVRDNNASNNEDICEWRINDNTTKICKDYAEYAVFLHNQAMNALVIPQKKIEVLPIFNDFITAVTMEYVQNFIKDFPDVTTSPRNIKFKYVILPDLSVSYMVSVKVIHKIADKVFKVKEVIMYALDHELAQDGILALVHVAIYSAIYDPVVSVTKEIQKIASEYNTKIAGNNVEVRYSDMECDYKVNQLGQPIATITAGITISSTLGYGKFTIGRTCSETYMGSILSISVISPEMVNILREISIIAATEAMNEIMADKNGIINAFIKTRNKNSTYALDGVASVLSGYRKHSGGIYFPIILSEVLVYGKIIAIEYIIDNNKQKATMRLASDQQTITTITKSAVTLIDGIIFKKLQCNAMQCNAMQCKAEIN